MSKGEKVFITIIISIISLFFLCAAWLIYAIDYKVSTKDIQISPDEQYTLKLQQIGMPGWPYGSANGKIILYCDGEKITEHQMVVGTDGGEIYPGCWDVLWGKSSVKILIYGELRSRLILGYDGTIESWEYDIESQYSRFAKCKAEFEILKEYIRCTFYDETDLCLQVALSDEEGRTLYNTETNSLINCPQDVRDALETLCEFGFTGDFELERLEKVGNRITLYTSNDKYAFVYDREERPTWFFEPNEKELFFSWRLEKDWYYLER